MTTTPEREAWTSFTGDVEFMISAQTDWAGVQRRYLDHYLPGKLGDQILRTFQLDITVDAAACHKLTEHTARTPHQRLKTVPGVVLLESRRPDGQRCFAVAADHLEHQTSAFAVQTRGIRVELYLDPNATKLHGYPLRMMREAMLRTYEDHDGLIFHAAGVDIDGRGVMVCAPRSAGKTTLLTRLLRGTHGDLLSNDRLILHNRSRLVAVPLPVPIARGTLDAVPELARMTTELSRPQGDVAKLPATFGATLKAEFSAREYAGALGSGLAAGSWLTTILVPRMTNTAEPVQITRLSEPEVRTVLESNCFTPHDEFWLQPWLVPRTTPDIELRARARDHIDDIAATIPCHVIHFGVHSSLNELDNAVLELVERYV